MTLADIALYAYTHVAPEGGFDLARVPGDPRVARPRRGRAGARPDRRLTPARCPAVSAAIGVTKLRFCHRDVSHLSQVPG